MVAAIARIIEEFFWDRSKVALVRGKEFVAIEGSLKGQTTARYTHYYDELLIATHRCG